MDGSYTSELLVLLAGLGNSLLVSVIGIALGAALGVVLGAIRYARVPVLHWLVVWFVNLFRCTVSGVLRPRP